MAIIISIALQKGGTGKTSTTIELAACMKAKGYKVLAVDLDQQANLSEYTSADSSKPGIYEVLSGTNSLKDVIQHVPEFDVVSSSSKLSKADREFSDALDVLKLKKSLRSVNEDYDFIFVDLNPARNVLLNMAYVASDYIIIPAEAEEGSLQGIKAIFHDLQRYKDDGFSEADILGVILTKYEKTGMHAYMQDKISELLKEYCPNAFLLTVRKSIVANEAKSEQTSMQVGKHNSKPAEDYRTIADEILKIVL